MVRATSRATRARLLPAQIDIALAARDLETAGAAVAELESIAADFQRPVFEPFTPKPFEQQIAEVTGHEHARDEHNDD